MIFNFLIRKTQAEVHKISVHIPAGSLIRGLQKQGTRPSSVTLTHKELAELLRNPKYTLTTVLPSLQMENST